MQSIKKYSLSGPAGNLECVAHLPVHAPRGIAVVAHPLPTMGGTMDNKIVTTLCKTFVELGLVALRFNFRGVGASSGSFDEGAGETEDLLAVVRDAELSYGALPLLLAGFSFGGYVQACAAKQLQAAKMVLIAPAVGRFNMPEVPAGTLLIHGDLDDVVTLADMLDWARPQHLPIVVLPGADHYFHGRLGQLKQIVLQHFHGQPV